MTPEEICLKAAEIIERNGWNQGSFVSDDGSVCIAGAARMASWGSVYTKNDRNLAAYFEARRLIREVIQEPDVVEWNDAPQRSKEDVILALKQAGTP